MFKIFINKVLEVFKGDVDKDEILIVTDTCLDKPVPERMLGYPVVEDYCRGLIGLRLTGVDSQECINFSFYMAI